MAAGATYTPIATTTLGSSATSYTFSSIAGTYTDLVLITNFGVTTGGSGAALSLRFNSDSGSNYSGTTLYGNGSSAASQRFSNQSVINIERSIGPTASAIETNALIQIQNYSNTTTYKTTISRANTPTGTYPGTETTVNLWRSTSAINSVTVLFLGGESFVTGSTFTLYGIAAA
jgi:hypothetical protein